MISHYLQTRLKFFGVCFFYEIVTTFQILLPDICHQESPGPAKLNNSRVPCFPVSMPPSCCTLCLENHSTFLFSSIFIFSILEGSVQMPLLTPSLSHTAFENVSPFWTPIELYLYLYVCLIGFTHQLFISLKSKFKIQNRVINEIIITHVPITQDYQLLSFIFASIFLKEVKHYR